MRIRPRPVPRGRAAQRGRPAGRGRSRRASVGSESSKINDLRSGTGKGPARRGRLFVIAAPSGTGKTSLVKALMNEVPALAFSVSHTTRARRPNEVEGRDYHFVSPDEFRAMIAAGAFLEYASVFDNYYGTSLATVEAALGRGQDLLLEIDWQGARQVRARLPEAIDVFVLPPSRAALEERLRSRATDSDAIISRRLRDSVTELSHWDEFRYVIVNDRFESALAELKRIVDGQGADLVRERPGLPEFARGLLA